MFGLFFLLVPGYDPNRHDGDRDEECAKQIKDIMETRARHVLLGGEQIYLIVICKYGEQPDHDAVSFVVEDVSSSFSASVLMLSRCIR